MHNYNNKKITEIFREVFIYTYVFNQKNCTIDFSGKVENTFLSNGIETPTKIKVNKNFESDQMLKVS